MHLSFWSCLIFTHSFCVCYNLLSKGGNKFVPRLYYRWYLDNDTPNGDNDINDDDDNEKIWLMIII